MQAGVVYPQVELGGDAGVTMGADPTTVDGHIEAIRRWVPARTLRNGLADAPLQIHEPHSGHTHRDTLLPLSAVWSIARGSPVRWKACASISITRENALLVKR
jgi:hypothetical protein